jgi:parvulin-like peptidyl-prolyl isomerase
MRQSALVSMLLLAATAWGQELPPGVTRERVYPIKDLPVDVVAEVNGAPVSRQELHAAMLEETGMEVLRELIKERVIRQEAERAGVHFAGEELDREVQAELTRVRDRLRREYGGSRPTLEELLAVAGRSIESFLEELRRRVEVKMLLEAMVLLDRLAVERVEIRLIQVRTRETAESVLHRLAEGADFSRLAAKESIHASGERGGLWPPFARGSFKDLYAAVEEAAFALTEPGEISGIIRVLNERNREEFYILQLVQRHQARTGTFATLRETIQDLRRSDPPTAEEADAWMGERLDRAAVFVDLK